MSRSKHHAMDHCPWLDPQHRDGSRSPGSSVGGTTYDPDSGQVYKERTVPAIKKQRFNWVYQYKTPTLVKRRRPVNVEGAASLFDMAKGQVARDIQHLTTRHLQGIPASVGKKLWQEVEDSRTESFHTWRTFVSIWPESFHSPFRRYFMDIKEPVLPLREYFAGLDSEVPIWLTCLRVNPGQLDRSDLIRIAQLRNLVVLDLSDDMSMDSKGTQIDERVFKTWAEMAQEGQAFKHLRALLLRGQAEVSGWIFNYLDHFPSLCFVVVSDCSQMHQKNRWEWIDQATSSGWEARHAKKSAKSLRSLIDDRNFYLGAVSGCYYHTKEAFDELANQKKSKLTDRVPVVEVWIGKPKPWLHLIEEFPGTRTVWFDNTKTREAARKAEARRKQEAPTMAKSARVKAAQLEEHTKRTRDMVSPSSDTKSPPPKRSMMMLRSRTRNLDQVMADFS